MLQITGNTIPGEGFFGLSYVEEEDELSCGALGAHAAIITMSSGNLSSHILESELPHFFEGDWDWQVEQLGDDMFSMVFPNMVMLRMATHSGKHFLSLNNIMADIWESVFEVPKAVIMPEVWLKLWGVPPK
ncbi:hypothetical protein ZWY2020_032750 [Hordeum vulgare]|nr:hypothetical protein ZWY2020_032750 [Hordeum vulgare]